MPFEPIEPSLTTSLPSNQIPEKKEDLGYIDVIGDAFRIDNPVVALFKDKDTTVDPESGFNALQRAEEDGLPLEVIDSFLFVDNEKEYKDTYKTVMEDLQARDRLASSGLSGVMASITAATLSPSIFIGGGAAVNALKAGKSAIKTAGITGAAVGGTVLAEEKLLQATQAGRTDEEVAINTATGFLLGGLLSGGGVALSNARMNKAAGELKGNLLAQMEVGRAPDSMAGFAEFNDSVGAASVRLTKEQMGIAKTNSKLMQPFLDGYVKLNKLWNPAVRMMSSTSRSARKYFLDLADTSIKPQAVKEGVALDESLEGVLKRRHGEFAQEIDKFRQTFKAYKSDFKGADKFKFKWMNFRKEVGKAFHSDTPHPNKHINAAVQQFQEYYEKIAKELIDEGLMPEDILTPKDGARYLNRIWNREKIKGNLGKFKADIEPYMRSQLTKIKNRIMRTMDEVDARGKPTKEALAAREDFRKFFDEDEFEGYLKESIDSIANNLLGIDNVGFRPTVAGAKGPLKKRSFNIPDKDILDYLDTDILFLSDTYTRQIIPEIEFKRKFGDTKLEDIAKNISKDYDEALEGASPSKSKKLLKEKQDVLRDVETTYNLLKGTYRGFQGPMDSVIKRGSDALLAHNYMVALGGVVISSIPDIGMGILRRGFGNFFGKSLKPFIKDMGSTLGKLSRTEARSYSQAMEYVTSLRSQSLYSVGDPMAFGGTPFERFINTASNKMSNLNLINQWNDSWQTLAVLGTRFRIVNNALDQAKGKKISAREREWLNFMGLSETKLKRINAQIEKYGTTDANGDIIPLINKWDDVEASNAFKSAVNKEVDRTVITKGATDVPRFGNTQLGKILFQWQNFNFAFNNKVIISALQDADGRVALGMGTLVTMGMITEALKNKQSGREMPENPAQWIDAGLDRSGMLGLLAYGNSFAEVAGLSYKELLGEEAPAPGGKTALDTVFGPSGRTVRQFTLLGQAGIKALGGDEFTQKDLKRLRSQTWGQNILYLKPIFDELESKVGEDLPESRR